MFGGKVVPSRRTSGADIQFSVRVQKMSVLH